MTSGNRPILTSGRPTRALVRRHRHVAEREQAEAAGERIAVDAGDQRLAEPARRARETHVRVFRHVVAEGERAVLRIRLEVGAGREGFVAGAGQHDGADAGIPIRNRQRLDQRVKHHAVQGIAPFRPVNRQPKDAVAPFDDNRFVAAIHRCPSVAGAESST